MRDVPGHAVEYDPLINSQLASRNSLLGFTWSKHGHETPWIGGRTKPSHSTVRHESDVVGVEFVQTGLRDWSTAEGRWRMR